MYLLMFRQFLRTRTCMIGLGLLVILGGISIMIGKQYLSEQEKAAAQVVENQLTHIDRNVELHHDDLGLLLYYLKFSVFNAPSPLAGLATGQQDINPNVLSVTLLTLEGQKYDTDLVNPTQLLYGNLDLSFILVYVCPLIIIAFSYNLRSEEEEIGTWQLVNIMTNSSVSYLVKKLSVRAVLLLSAMVLLYFSAAFAMGIPIDSVFLLFMLTGLLYLMFWFALSFWVVSFKRNSSFSALTLLSLWMGLVVLLPATVNSIVTLQYPVPEALTTIIKQRDAYHQKWDSNKRATIEKFYARYPQLESFGYPPEEGFNWLWYYAMQHAGDEESQAESDMMRDKVLTREKVSRNWAYFVPTMHTQLALNELAGTSLGNHIDFLDYAEDFHERTRLFFYPKIFSKVDAREIEWGQFEPEFRQASLEIEWIPMLLPLVIAMLMFTGLTIINNRKSS